MQKTPESVFVTQAFFPLKRGPQMDSYDESKGPNGKATINKAVALVNKPSMKLKYYVQKSFPILKDNSTVNIARIAKAARHK